MESFSSPSVLLHIIPCVIGHGLQVRRYILRHRGLKCCPHDVTMLFATKCSQYNLRMNMNKSLILLKIQIQHFDISFSRVKPRYVVVVEEINNKHKIHLMLQEKLLF